MFDYPHAGRLVPGEAGHAAEGGAPRKRSGVQVNEWNDLTL